MNKSLILLGGGLDSTTLLVDLVKQGTKLMDAIFFDYGQKAFMKEWESVEYFCDKYNVRFKVVEVDIGQIASCSIMEGSKVGKRASQNVLVGRNSIFLSMAVTYACTLNATNIYVGFHDEPVNSRFEDATMSFVSSFNEYIKSYLPKEHQKIRVVAPYSPLTREEVLNIGNRLDPDIVAKSWTCYEAGPKECRKCVHCKKKQSMMKKLGIKSCAE